uniref:TSA: Wollemia nobilis Ref_Wollemi_Transcript_29247_1074 transcribed RNA sequence n=1 Tax=Wollemia nobilis TaxID=56998 RepID=A0A0C9QKZ6_9CONI
MGSEGPPAVSIHVTGFKKFHGVAENPAEWIVRNLEEFLKKEEKKNEAVLNGLCSCNVLETAGDGALTSLYQLLELPLSFPDINNGQRVIWVHFGVNGGANKFAIECQAVNEATFRCPDEMGWQPQKIPIVPEDGSLSHVRETSLPAAEIVEILVDKGYDVTLSDDAGRFVCNYVYYHSLRYGGLRGFKSLFVHVPLFTKIDRETQMHFAASLLEVLTSIC